MTTLDLYCAFKGWQGGTIHQALEDFRSLPLARKDDFCNTLMANLGALTDGFAREFTKARIDQHMTVTAVGR